MPLLGREKKEPLRLHDIAIEPEKSMQLWDFDSIRDMWESD
jgi:hypothetical protein